MPTETAENKPFIASEAVPVSNPQNVQPVYANNVGAAGTATDFRLFFNELGTYPDGLAAKQSQEIKAIVVLPMAAAEIMIGILQHVVASQKVMAASLVNKAGEGVQ